MRRDQIFKICLNHGLTSDIKFLRKDDRSWLWAAKDFSEGEGTLATFVLRFRDTEVAGSFMEAIEKSLVLFYRSIFFNEFIIMFFFCFFSVSFDIQSSPSSTPDKDLQVVFLKEATEEQKRKALALKLPLNFFLYENAPPCPGCRGCDEEDVPVGKISTATKPEKDAPVNLFKLAESSVSHLSFSALAADSTSGFNKPSQFSWSGTGQPIFGVIIPIMIELCCTYITITFIGVIGRYHPTC